MFITANSSADEQNIDDLGKVSKKKSRKKSGDSPNRGGWGVGWVEGGLAKDNTFHVKFPVQPCLGKKTFDILESWLLFH